MDMSKDRAIEVCTRYAEGDRELLALEYAKDMAKTHHLNAKIKGFKEDAERWHEWVEYFEKMEKLEMRETKDIPPPPPMIDEDED